MVKCLFIASIIFCVFNSNLFFCIFRRYQASVPLYQNLLVNVFFYIFPSYGKQQTWCMLSFFSLILFLSWIILCFLAFFFTWCNMGWLLVSFVFSSWVWLGAWLTSRKKFIYLFNISGWKHYHQSCLILSLFPAMVQLYFFATLSLLVICRMNAMTTFWVTWCLCFFFQHLF